MKNQIVLIWVLGDCGKMACKLTNIPAKIIALQCRCTMKELIEKF